MKKIEHIEEFIAFVNFAKDVKAVREGAVEIGFNMNDDGSGDYYGSNGRGTIEPDGSASFYGDYGGTGEIDSYGDGRYSGEDGSTGEIDSYGNINLMDADNENVDLYDYDSSCGAVDVFHVEEFLDFVDFVSDVKLARIGCIGPAFDLGDNGIGIYDGSSGTGTIGSNGCAFFKGIYGGVGEVDDIYHGEYAGTDGSTGTVYIDGAMFLKDSNGKYFDFDNCKSYYDSYIDPPDFPKKEDGFIDLKETAIIGAIALGLLTYELLSTDTTPTINYEELDRRIESTREKSQKTTSKIFKVAAQTGEENDTARTIAYMIKTVRRSPLRAGRKEKKRKKEKHKRGKIATIFHWLSIAYKICVVYILIKIAIFIYQL